MVKFDLFESSTKELGQAWATQWCAVNPGRQSTDHLSVEVPADINNLDLNLHCPSVSEKWLEFLFYPDRFTTSTLATALHVYARGSTTSSSRGLLSDGKTPLKERICHAVSSKAVSSPADLQEISISEQWHVFYGLVRDLHKRRAVSLSFTIDPEELLPWVVSADFISPVRSCNDLDICDFHRTHEGNIPADDQVAKQLKTPYEILDFLHVAHVFRNSLSSTFDDDFNRAVLFELLQEPSTSVSDRMVALHEQCHIATHVSDEEWNRLRDAIDEVGGYDVLDYQNFCGILELLDQQPEGRQNKEQITRYGAKTLIRTAQETLALNKKTLMDLLLLVLFIEIEVDSAELASDMQGDWQGQDIFMEILAKLREIAVLDFLMSNVRTEQPKRSRQSISAESPTALRSSISGSSPIAVYTSTLMQSMFIGDWATIHVPSDDSLPELITYWARRWMSSEDITNQYESFTAHVLADLIKHDDEILATTFLPYVPTTGWSVYLRGRLNLLLGDFAMAATCFKKAAFSVCKYISTCHSQAIANSLSAFSYFDVAQSDTADLLRPDERDLFCDGLHPYYRHILDLFTNVKAPSHIVEFAQIALQHLSLGARDVGVVSQPDHDKSVADLLSRLFTAALQTSQYDIAYSALTRLPPTNPLVRASLTSFITTLIQHNRVSLLLSYPFATGLSRTVDHVLASLAAKILNVASSTGPAYHKILYAFRVQRGDYRGGAQCLWDYLARLKDSGEGVRDPQDERLVDAYLTCINALRCCGEEDAWVLDDPAGNTLGTAVSKLSLGAGGTGATPKRKRKVVLLADVRREYQALLDRIAELESGKFAFGADEDEMDVEFL
jgi:DNA repair protein RAD51/nuclear pore complex protein Nup160